MDNPAPPALTDGLTHDEILFVSELTSEVCRYLNARARLSGYAPDRGTLVARRVAMAAFISSTFASVIMRLGPESLFAEEIGRLENAAHGLAALLGDSIGHPAGQA